MSDSFITVQYDKTAFEGVIVEVINAPQRIVDYASKVIPPFFEQSIRPLKTEPRQPDLPFIWSHDPVKQRQKRAAYFKTLPRGSRGGRYVRSHRLAQGWKVGSHTDRDGAEFTIGNDVPYLDTVQGADQYPSHQDSGWQRYEPILITAGEEAAEMIVTEWLGILD